MSELFAADTNLYIRATRERVARDELRHFLLRIGPRVRLLAVVALELRAGAHDRAQQADVAALVGAYARRGRLVTPSESAYMEAGRVAADLALRERFDVARAAPSFMLDVLIAASCREAGITLVTWNSADNARIARHLRGFRAVAPWPRG